MPSTSRSYLLSSFLFLWVGHSITAHLDSQAAGIRRLVQTSGGDRCGRPNAFLCDCERVPRRIFFDIREAFRGEKLECDAVCDDTTPRSCTPSCDSVICIGGYLGENSEFCGMLIEREISDGIRNMNCAYDENMMVHLCTRGESELFVDDQTLQSVTKGSCVPGCDVDMDNLACQFDARYWGTVFEVELPVAPPFEPPEDPPELPPVDPPDIYIDYIYEIPDIEPSEPPEEPEIEVIELDLPPAPEIELFDYDYTEYIEPPLEPPTPSPILVRIEIPIDEGLDDEIENTLYYGPWSDCTQYCSQHGPRIQRRSVICRNSFGIPLPLDECDEFEKPDTIRECSFAKCIGDFYYVLGDWSPCNQECSSYNPNTKRMSEGFKRRQFTCLFLNGTQTDRKNCVDSMDDAGVDRTSVCGSQPCRPVRYILGPWEACDCDTKIRTRNVVCTDFDDISVEDDVCEALNIPKPRTVEYCLPENC